MKVTFRRSFEKDLKKVREQNLLHRVRAIIERIEAAETIQEIPNFERLSGASSFGRVRIGDYRLGLAIQGEEIDIVRLLHRREIYRFFP